MRGPATLFFTSINVLSISFMFATIPPCARGVGQTLLQVYYHFFLFVPHHNPTTPVPEMCSPNDFAALLTFLFSPQAGSPAKAS